MLSWLLFLFELRNLQEMEAFAVTKPSNLKPYKFKIECKEVMCHSRRGAVSIVTQRKIRMILCRLYGSPLYLIFSKLFETHAPRSGTSVLLSPRKDGFSAEISRSCEMQLSEESAHSRSAAHFSVPVSYNGATELLCEEPTGKLLVPNVCPMGVQRRGLLLSIGILGAAHFACAYAEDTTLLQLVTYSDSKESFSFLRPSLWNKVDKSGATVLFEDPEAKGNRIGVVVNPVRIFSLKELGTADDIADKIIQAELKKPSTKDAQLVKVRERQVHDSPLYQLEYVLDSARGYKRVLSSFTVYGKKLYILNIDYLDSPAIPASEELADAYQRILDSFDVIL